MMPLRSGLLFVMVATSAASSCDPNSEGLETCRSDFQPAARSGSGLIQVTNHPQGFQRHSHLKEYKASLHQFPSARLGEHMGPAGRQDKTAALDVHDEYADSYRSRADNQDDHSPRSGGAHTPPSRTETAADDDQEMERYHDNGHVHGDKFTANTDNGDTRARTDNDDTRAHNGLKEESTDSPSATAMGDSPMGNTGRSANTQGNGGGRSATSSKASDAVDSERWQGDEPNTQSREIGRSEASEAADSGPRGEHSKTHEKKRKEDDDEEDKDGAEDEETKLKKYSQLMEDFENVVQQNSNSHMAKFVCQLAKVLDLDVVDEGKMMGVIPFYSGVKEKKTFQELLEEMQASGKEDCGWLAPHEKGIFAAGTAPLSEEGYKQVAKRHNNQKMEIFARRIAKDMGMTITDAGGLQGIMPYFSCTKEKQTLEDLKKEIQDAASANTWAKHA